MIKKPKKNKKIFVLSIILGMFFVNIVLSNLALHKNPYLNDDYNDNNDLFNIDIIQNEDIKSQGTYEEFYTKEWLENPNFTSGVDPWYNTTSGDNTDVNASYSSGAANYEVLGDQRTFSFAENPPQASSWTVTQNPNFPFYPDTYTINANGMEVSHFWNEGADQSVAVNWDQNFTMPVNMSDYIITSANISALVNGSVTTPSFQPYSDGVDTAADSTDQFATGDYVRFYILVSDLQKNNVYEIDYYQSSDLGQDSGPTIATLSDTYMIPVTEETLKFYLTSALNADDYNFTLTLGMRIWCEDNFAQDSDEWLSLIINSVNLTFTYEKKIDQLTTLSWNQVGNKLSGANIDIMNATLNYRYKVDQSWPSTSPNSEFRIIINGTQHSETVKLSSATASYQDAKTNGFDVTSLIKKDVNISLSILLFIADEFKLGSKITLSIDNVSLLISYKETKDEDLTTLDLFLNTVNSTLDKLIEVRKGELVNITVKYRNSTKGFIDNANVNITGDGIIGTVSLEEQTALEQYNITIDTVDLEYGNNYLTITASKFTYETQIISNFKIKVLDIEANITSIILNDVDHTSDKTLEISAGKLLNITVAYTNNSGGFIEGATVEVTGSLVSLELNESLSLQHYNITLNTTDDIGIGVSFLTISAQKENHTSVTEQLTIIVWEEEASLDLYLNGLNKTDEKYIQLNVNKTLNITVSFKDDLNQHISSAQINLTGSGIDQQFSEITNNYTTKVNTSDLNQGVTFLNIYAYKDGYDPQAMRITVEIVQELTKLRLFLNGTDKTIDKTDEIDIGQKLNITVTYNVSSSGAFIGEAIVKIIGGYYDDTNLTEYGGLEQYSIIINSTDLNWGVNYITIYAYKSNYEGQTITFKLSIIDKATTLDLYLNGTKRVTEEEKSISIAWNEILNITAVFEEDPSGNFIPGATVQLKEGLTIIGSLFRPGLINHYNYSLNTTDLTIGPHFLTIEVNITNYEAQTVVFRIDVLDRETEFGDVLLNQQSTTLLTLAWNETVEIVVQYNDTDTHGLIYNATVELKNGTSVYGELLKHQTLEQYNLTINTANLIIGNNYFTLVCSKDNYTTISKEIIIRVNRRETYIEIFLNGANKTLVPSLVIAFGEDLEILISYIDKDTDSVISDATVQLMGDSISEVISWNILLGNYSIDTIDTKTDLIIGPNFLYVEINKTNFDPISKSIKIEVRTLDLEVTTESGDSTINAEPGDDVTLTIYINNLDFGGKIKGADVSYTSDISKKDIKEGDIEEVSDGVYEVVLKNVPEGTFLITITVFGDEDDGYETIRYEINLVVKRPQEETLLFQILLVIAVLTIIGLTTYLILYQKVLKYPKPIRKVRGYRKSIKKKSPPSVAIESREIAFSAMQVVSLGSMAKSLKSKGAETKEIPDKLAKKKAEAIEKKPPAKAEKKLPDKVEEKLPDTKPEETPDKK